MDILIIAVLIIAAVILFLVELFVIPGISLAGISALVCILYANYYAFTNLGMAGGFVTLGISAVACIGSLIWFMRSKMLDKLALKKDIDSKVDRSAEDSVKVGDIGISTTRLAQIGYAEINGKIVEVKSIDGFLNEKTPIIVSRITDGTIIGFFTIYRVNSEWNPFSFSCIWISSKFNRYGIISYIIFIWTRSDRPPHILFVCFHQFIPPSSARLNNCKIGGLFLSFGIYK